MVYAPYYGVPAPVAAGPGGIGWVNGPGGHTPETDLALDTMELGIIAATPRWAPSTAYALGEQVVSPNNDIVSAIAAHTSGASYTAANWTLSGTYVAQDSPGYPGAGLAYARARAMDLRAYPGVDPTGATDCSVALQAGVTAAITEGCPVELPYGTYKGAFSWAPGNNKDISLTGLAGSLLVAPAAGTSVVTIDGGTSNWQRQVISGLDFDLNGYDAPALLLRSFGQVGVVEKINVKGMAAAPTRGAIEFGDGVSTPNDIVFGTVRDVEVKGSSTTAGSAFLFRSRVDSLTLENCRGLNVGTAFRNDPTTCQGGSSLAFIRCIAEQTQDGWSLTGFEVEKLLLWGNRIEAFSRYGMDLNGIDANYVMGGVTVEDGYFSAMTSGAIGVRMSLAAAVAINNNFFTAVNGLSSGTYPVGTPVSIGANVTRYRQRGNRNGPAADAGAVLVRDSVGPIVLPSTNYLTSLDIRRDQDSLDVGNLTAQPRTLISGRYYGTNGGAPSTSAVAVGGFSLTPVYIPNDVTVDRIECEVTTIGTTGAVVRLGIYDSNIDGKPLNLILDAGTVAADGATGVKSQTISQALAPGLYWLMAAGQVAGSTLRIIGFSPASPVAGTAYSPGGNVGYNCYSGSGMTGALTTPLSSGLTAASGGIKVMVRIV
jgi:hypothetical protein